MSLSSGMRTRMLAVLLSAGAFFALTAGPASAATYTGTNKGACAQASGTAYRAQLKIPVTELKVKVYEFFREIGQVDVVTAFMTMNVEWCSNGSNVTYATVASNNAERTTAGKTTLLERKSYTKSGTPPTAVGGPYTLTTAATWGRTAKGSISAAPFGLGGNVELTPANFTSTMTVKVYPTNATVECTGTSSGHAEPCSLNP